jgi:hypothetical protein
LAAVITSARLTLALRAWASVLWTRCARSTTPASTAIASARRTISMVAAAFAALGLAFVIGIAILVSGFLCPGGQKQRIQIQISFW